MNKRALAILLGGALALTLCACGSDDGGSATQDPASPPDLTGVWTQVGANEGDSYQQAIISGNTITINWVDPESTALYWAGTFAAPTTTDEPYTWTSENDTSKTGTALLASTSDTKAFTYEDGKISYEVSALGSTTTVSLEKTGDAPAVIEEPESNYEVTIDSASIEANPYTGDRALIVNCTFTNNSEENAAPDVALHIQAFQDGIELDPDFFDSSSYDSMSASREVQPGNTYEFQKAFVLTNETSSIDVSVSELFALDGGTLAEKTFDPATLA